MQRSAGRASERRRRSTEALREQPSSRQTAETSNGHHVITKVAVHGRRGVRQQSAGDQSTAETGAGDVRLSKENEIYLFDRDFQCVRNCERRVGHQGLPVSSSPTDRHHLAANWRSPRQRTETGETN